MLVAGAGPIGLLAALLGVQRGLDVHALDRVIDGPKPLGATYHHQPVDDLAARLQPDVIIEATGAGEVVIAAMATTARYGIVYLTGMSPAGRTVHIDADALKRDIVLENDAVVGSMNSNTRHSRPAAQALSHRATDAFIPATATSRSPSISRMSDQGCQSGLALFGEHRPSAQVAGQRRCNASRTCWTS
ncbi:theronine dehydrogenase-like Zn-dependent dehydrogenase [Mycolicibacterium aurum]|uniref:Theronine dehydrogenase-like Zn-dependent dehydrogenase n=1 Tax=Mycolicibacterium aurum TaxID=1791 RepID=A0A3S4RSC1_MYCAU|nr:hypothetical protein [Mycolicibacterium aurum]VEG54366.1 theronine dehydrogenase-like Zn-dependent dehydrogenase [Mycolicibacterium aurum]